MRSNCWWTPLLAQSESGDHANVYNLSWFIIISELPLKLLVLCKLRLLVDVVSSMKNCTTRSRESDDNLLCLIKWKVIHDPFKFDTKKGIKSRARDASNHFTRKTNFNVTSDREEKKLHNISLLNLWTFLPFLGRERRFVCWNHYVSGERE